MWRGVSDAQWARVREHLPAWKADPRGGRPRRTHRLALLAHHDACRPCSSLFTFARERNDLGALAAWRSQLAEHLAADRERRDFDRDVLAQLTRPLGSGPDVYGRASRRSIQRASETTHPTPSRSESRRASLRTVGIKDGSGVVTPGGSRLSDR